MWPFFYMLAILILQTVVFPRLNFMGVVPDLILVSVIVFAVVEERNPSTLFAAVLSFLQDLFSAGVYLNTIAKTIISNLISSVKEGFVGDEYSLCLLLVLIFSPLYILVEGGVLYFFFQKQFGLFYFIFRMVAATIYNLALVPILFPIVRKIAHD